MQRPAESAAISAKKSLQHGLWQGAERCRKLAESVARHVLKRVPSDSELFNRFVGDCFCFTLEVLVLRILLALVIVWSAVGALRLGQCPSVNMCEHKESSYNMLQHQAG